MHRRIDFSNSYYHRRLSVVPPFCLRSESLVPSIPRSLVPCEALGNMVPPRPELFKVDKEPRCLSWFRVQKDRLVLYNSDLAYPQINIICLNADKKVTHDMRPLQRQHIRHVWKQPIFYVSETDHLPELS